METITIETPLECPTTTGHDRDGKYFICQTCFQNWPDDMKSACYYAFEQLKKYKKP